MVPTDAWFAGRKIRLKWRQLRQQPQDPPFTRANLRAGLAAGASLEVDIQRLAGGRFVCLHEPLLEAETTGRGPVVAADAEAVSEMRMLGSGERPLLLDELVDIVRAGPTGPGALVQLDLCSDVAVGAETALVELLSNNTDRFILGGYDWVTVARLGALTPGLALGYDPSEDFMARGGDVVSLVRDTASEAETIYLRHDLVAGAPSMVSQLQAYGHRIDAWTIDAGVPNAQRDFDAVAAAGCDQITTNTPAAWADAYPRLETQRQGG